MPDNGGVIGVSDHGGWAVLVTVARDGTLLDRRRVELVDDEGQPLRMQDEKHKPLKYDIIARDGYRAHLEVE